MKTTVFIIAVVLFVLQLNGQVRDSSVVADVIIQVDGTVLHGKVIEVNTDQVKYHDISIKDGPILVLPRNLIYMISYSNNTTQIITPQFGKKKIEQKAFDENKVETSYNTDNADHNFRYNLGHGTIKFGFGFSPVNTSVKGVDGYNKSQNFPSMEASYQFILKRYLILGVNLGYAGYNYQFSEESEYDQMEISKDVEETFLNYGIFARYDIMHDFFRPYALMGLDVNYTIVNTDGMIHFKEEAKKFSTSSSAKGFKTYFILRGGFDFHIGKSFGLFTDVGTGASLVKVGVMFVLN